jgi:C1A family cysteine protease
MTGNVPIPNTRREQLLGGHAVCVIGYDDSKSAFLVRNSWGSRWGWNGNFWLPYAYATNTNLAFDAWALYSDRLVASSPNVSVTIPTHPK